MERLNGAWRVAGPEPAQGSLTQRLAYPLRRAIARVLRPQEAFNSMVVQFANAVDHVLSLYGAGAGFDEVARSREALAARERRIESALSAIRASHDELRTSVATVQQLTHNLARDVAAMRASGGAATPASFPGTSAPAERLVPANTSDALSYKYVGFEDQFRGSPETIRAGLAEYVPIFGGASDVLDVGCGRGEFLALLRDQGITARGIDLNDSMIEVCLGKGLDASRGDALSYLRAQPDGSLGGLFAAQVVEHLEPGYLTQMLDAAFDKLRPGAPIVLETINPACWFAFFQSYIRDITHVRPLHPDTLRFLLVATGFQQLEIRYRAPYPEHDKLQAIPRVTALGDSVETLNANVEKINRLLFTYLDYAAIGRRP
jgi:O-antigen chain-terminating methyltransferase